MPSKGPMSRPSSGHCSMESPSAVRRDRSTSEKSFTWRDLNDNAADRSCLVLATPNVIMNDTRLGGTCGWRQPRGMDLRDAVVTWSAASDLR
jgi:hypothetical protein